MTRASLPKAFVALLLLFALPNSSTAQDERLPNLDQPVPPVVLHNRSTSQDEVLPNPKKPVPPVVYTGIEVPITYNSELTNTPFTDGDGIQGSTSFGNINDPATWEYYNFCAVEGDQIIIEVHRTTSAMDPAMHVCFGTTTDSDGLSSFSCGTNPDLGPLIAEADDNNGIPHGVGGAFTDPRVDFIAPLTGEYTLMVYDFLGVGPIPEFEIHVSGITPCTISSSCTVDMIADGGSVDTAVVVGTVTTDLNDDGTWNVTYETTGNWVIKETHLHLACDPADFPKTRRGNPRVGRFDHKTDHDSVQTFTYENVAVPAPGCDCVLFAAHASVCDPQNKREETAWGDGQPFLARGNWAMFFQCGNCDP